MAALRVRETLLSFVLLPSLYLLITLVNPMPFGKAFLQNVDVISIDRQATSAFNVVLPHHFLGF